MANPVGRPNIPFDLGKALKLRLKGLSYHDVGIIMGTNRQAIQGKIEPLLKNLNAPEEITAFRANESALISGVKMNLLTNIADRSANNKGSLSENVLAYGVLFDKSRLLESKSTANISVLTQVIEDAANDAVEIPDDGAIDV